MRRFVPGVDSYLGAGIPASLMRFSEPASDSDASEGGHLRPPVISEVTLIKEHATTLTDKYRQLCLWRQVVNAESN